MAEFYINKNGDITHSNLYLLAKADFNYYKIHSTLLPSLITHTPGPTRSLFTVVSGMSNSHVTLLNCKKGTKRDLSAYLTCRSEKYNDSSHHSFHATTRAQGLGDILDPKGTPTTAELLSSEQQSFRYSVLAVLSILKEERNSPKNSRMMPSESLWRS